MVFLLLIRRLLGICVGLWWVEGHLISKATAAEYFKKRYKEVAGWKWEESMAVVYLRRSLLDG